MLIEKLKEIYYWLTAHVPRRIPRDQMEMEGLKDVLKSYFGVRDRHDVWLTICGHLTSIKSTNVRISYGSLANAGKRLDMNKVAHDEKLFHVEALQRKLGEAAKKLAQQEESNAEKESDMQQGPHDI